MNKVLISKAFVVNEGKVSVKDLLIRVKELKKSKIIFLNLMSKKQ